jgi:hypothetical protein
MSGAWWGGTDNFDLIEDKHRTGYCLELSCRKIAKVPIGVEPEWEEFFALIDTITVPQAEYLADHLATWAKDMREGGHYKNGKKG